MTVDETKKFLAIVKVAFPAAYRDIDKETAWATVKLWHDLFEKVPYFAMESAFYRYLKHGKYAPTIAEMTEELSSLSSELIAEAAACRAKCDMNGVGKYLNVADSIDAAMSFLEDGKYLVIGGGGI